MGLHFMRARRATHMGCVCATPATPLHTRSRRTRRGHKVAKLLRAGCQPSAVCPLPPRPCSHPHASPRHHRHRHHLRPHRHQHSPLSPPPPQPSPSMQAAAPCACQRLPVPSACDWIDAMGRCCARRTPDAPGGAVGVLCRGTAAQRCALVSRNAIYFRVARSVCF